MVFQGAHYRETLPARPTRRNYPALAACVLDPLVQFPFAVDPVNPLWLQGSQLTLRKCRNTTQTPSFVGFGRPDLQVSCLFVFVTLKRAIAIVCFTGAKGAASQCNADAVSHHCILVMWIIRKAGPPMGLRAERRPELRNLSNCRSIRLAPRDVYRDVRGQTTCERLMPGLA